MVNKTLWYIDGFKKALENKNVEEWIINYFKEHSEKIIYEACEWLICNEDSDKYISLCLNANDDGDINFIVQKCGDDIHWFFVKEDYSDCKEKFNEALIVFYKELNKL